MSLEIKINGQSYYNFQNASVIASVTALTRGFSFVSSADENNSFPIKIGDLVVITADGLDLLTGYIENLEVNYSSDTHTIRVGGRSRLMDFVDSTVLTPFEINGTSLESIATSLLSTLGIPGKISNEAGTINKFEDISSAEVGQNAFEFLEKYSRKRQVLLTSDGNDTLVFARTGKTYAPSDLKNIRGGADNNILTATLSVDYTERFYKYIVKSQLNTSTPGFDTDPADVSDQEGQALDGDIRKTRLLELNSEESMESFSSGDRAIWEKNIRIGNGLNYVVKVVGNTYNGKLWLPNTLVKVEDEFCQLRRTLLIKEVRYNFSLTDGSTTTLTMIPEGAFSLAQEQSEREANKDEDIWTI